MTFDVSYHMSFCLRCSSIKKSDERPNFMQKLSHVNINGTKSFPTSKIDLFSKDHRNKVVCFDSSDQNAHSILNQQQIRQNITTEKQLVDAYRLGVVIEEGIVYRQTVVVRFYEVGPDKTMTIESILNLFQETSLNQVWMSGLLGNGFGATHSMIRNNVIWVFSRMHVQVDTYPVWGEVMEIETWVGAAGEHAMRRDWQIRSQATGLILARATCTGVMMNEQSRRLSKIPDDVMAEMTPWLTDKQVIQEVVSEKIHKLDDNNARYVLSNLKPKRSDLDINQHVNNAKYVGWMLESMPEEFLDKYQLSNIILEYKKQCGNRDVVQSLSDPDDNQELVEPLGCLNQQSFIRNTHLLQIKGQTKNEEILRGKTAWKRKVISP